MRPAPWITCLWPGLPRLWRGEWSGLVTAIWFAAVLNVALATSLLWPELVAPSVRGTVWLLVVGVWISWLLFCLWRPPKSSGGGSDRGVEDLFVSAQGQYLQGNWYQAEAILGRLLKREPGDVEARLMLATLHRHTRRYGEARRQLDRLERLESSQRWQREIRRERELLSRSQQEVQDDLEVDARQNDDPQTGRAA